MKKGLQMLSVLNDYDWENAFGCAGEPTSYIGSHIVSALPNQIISLNTFTREDVKSILAMREGEHDGANWLMAGKLKDKRWFFISAGCDYTGWD